MLLASWLATASVLAAAISERPPFSLQPGSFYGGWITGNIEGPFKGSPGSGGW